MSQAGQAAPPRTIGANREVEETATARALCYAAFSELTASPHDIDALGAVRERRETAADLLPAQLLALMDEFLGSEQDMLRMSYSNLFEIGSDGPPASIREALFVTDRPATREELIRFHDYFGYQLSEEFAWIPDHLSVELELMHYLCYHEVVDVEDRLSWQLGQADFAARHLASWVPDLAARVEELAPGGFYARLLQTLADFLRADLVWQQSTIKEVPSEAGNQLK